MEQWNSSGRLSQGAITITGERHAHSSGTEYEQVQPSFFPGLVIQLGDLWGA